VEINSDFTKADGKSVAFLQHVALSQLIYFNFRRLHIEQRSLSGWLLTENNL